MSNAQNSKISFDHRPSTSHKTLSQLSETGKQRLAALRKYQSIRPLEREFRARMPTGTATSNALPPGVTQYIPPPTGVQIFTDGPSTALVENTFYFAPVFVFNFTNSVLKGTLVSTIDGETNQFASYTMPDLQPDASWQTNILVEAPRAGTGHKVQVNLLGQSDRPVKEGKSIAEANFTFDTLALYKITIVSIHISRTMAPRTDCVVFGIGAAPELGYNVQFGSVTYPDLQWALYGNHQDGATIGVNYEVTVPATTGSTPLPLVQYFVANNGNVLSGYEASAFVAKFMAAWDLIGAAVTNAHVAQTQPNDGENTNLEVTASGSSFLWFEIAWHIYTLDCNGICAAEYLTKTGDELDANTWNGAVWTETVEFDGPNTSVGCGANSKYEIIRTISRAS